MTLKGVQTDCNLRAECLGLFPAVKQRDQTAPQSSATTPRAKRLPNTKIWSLPANICGEGQLKDPASVTYLYRISHQSFINAFNTHELSIYSVPDAVLGTEYPGIDKTVEISALLNLTV